ncbi:MAG: hypothetical protein C5B49_03365 [Bdellovibrio sp.]|nr:MAG: hypothetical protein C5B49_03365 [Bdellovibrio sp.]
MAFAHVQAHNWAVKQKLKISARGGFAAHARKRHPNHHVLWLLFLTVLVVAGSATPATAKHKKKQPHSADFKAVCKKMTAADWSANYGGCMKAFLPGVQGHKISHANAGQICGCVADGLTKEPPCSEIKRFRSDKGFQKTVTDRMARKCLPQQKTALKSD